MKYINELQAKIHKKFHNENKEVDFLFVYELRARELESICLIGYELRRRGYSVAYINTWNEMDNEKRNLIAAKVVIAFAAYDKATIEFVLSFVKSTQKIVNMQWEQLLGIGEKSDCKSNYYIKEEAKEIKHFSWGDDNYDRLVDDCHIDPCYVKKVGHVGMDFLRKELSNYYFSREEICDLYQIDKELKICLFISSFFYVSIPKVYESHVEQLFVDVSRESQKSILSWIKRILKQEKDIMFVYRPHPTESENNELLELEKEENRFRVIMDYSIKQWIKVSDVIYNWYSTSLMEVYSANKGCHILRPVEIPYEYEISIFEKARFITTFEEFEQTISQADTFPLDAEVMEKYYFLDREEPTYLKIVKELIETYEDKSENHKIDFVNKQSLGLKSKIRKSKGFQFAKKIKLNIQAKRGNELAKQDLFFKQYASQMRKNNFVSQKEMDSIFNKIRNVLNEEW